MKHEDIDEFKIFVQQNKPGFIGIDASGLQSRRFVIEIREILSHLKGYEKTLVMLVNPTIARIYRTSQYSLKELNHYPSGMRMAISLARFCVNPVSEISNLWHYDEVNGINNILSLPLNTETRFIENEHIIQSLQCVLIQEVCDSGINLNACLQRIHQQGMIQFISGLGKERSRHLMDSLILVQGFTSRNNLLKSNNLNGIFPPKIWNNAISFLRIESNEKNKLQELNNPISLFDSMEIHPSNYEYAEIVINSALDLSRDKKIRSKKDVSDKKTSAFKVKDINKKIIQIRTRNQQTIDNLNLEAFANMIKNSDNKRILIFLNKIKDEIKLSYHDRRLPLKNLEKFPEELFELLTGESKRTLVKGMMLTCQIVKSNHLGIRCKLDRGLNCWLPIKNCNNIFLNQIKEIDEKHKNDEFKKKEKRNLLLSRTFKKGNHITARVMNIDKQRLSIKLSMLKKDVENQKEVDSFVNHSSFLILNHPDDDLQKTIAQENISRNIQQKTYIRRQINFQYFENVSRFEAKELLAKKDVGSIIIRPSSYTIDQLTLSWKITHNPDIIVNFKIREKEKSNPFSLGKKLVIEGETYNDLDELVMLFIERLNELKKTIINYKQFIFGSEKDVIKFLQNQKFEEQKKIPYSLSYSYAQPGRFLLSYILGQSEIQQEFITLTYQGFRFRGAVFRDPLNLVTWFKRHPDRRYRLDQRKRLLTE